ncbi:MAG: transcriptional repressor LexA [Eubacteriaceae bacterium]
MYEDLSVKQLAVLKYIKLQMQNKGYPPSVREICAAVNLKSTSTVHAYLKRLEELGYIRRDLAKTRAIEVVSYDPNDGFATCFEKKNVISLPILGCITAGAPILAVENVSDIFPLPIDFVGNENSFILEVRGTSMINAGIFDGDRVIVSQQNSAENGEIVVVLICSENEATVKRIYFENNQVRLQPENDALSPTFFPEEDIRVLGKVTALIRKF